jgi:hypothetical protein
MLPEMPEYPNSFGPLARGDERIETGRYTLCLDAGSTWNTVQRQRFPLDQLDEVLAEVRAHCAPVDGRRRSVRSGARRRRDSSTR